MIFKAVSARNAVLAGLFAALFPGFAAAQDFERITTSLTDTLQTAIDLLPPGVNDVRLGLGPGVYPDFEGSRHSRVHAVPVVSLRYRDLIEVTNNEIKVTAFNKLFAPAVNSDKPGGSLRVGPLISINFGRDESDSPDLKGMGDIGTSFEVGAFVSYLLPNDRVRVRLRQDVAGGHKTGFYLDQRDNRLLTGQLAAGRDVLNCFCYTGGFSLQALAGGAKSVISIDSSGPALVTAARNLAHNPQLDASRAEWREDDVFQALRGFKTEGRKFDLIILDPPKFAPSAAHAERAARAYKDINLLGFRLLNPGGILMTYSCSGGIGHELFQKIVASAAADVGVEARILHRLSAAPDHPIGLAVPEGEYLKGLACQV